MPAAIETTVSSEWMTQQAAAKTVGRAVTAIQRLALIGEIKTQALPGRPVRYCRADVERLAAQFQFQFQPAKLRA